jgi:hypothetical protein
MVEVRLWTQKQDIGPSTRGSHVMSLDSHKKKKLLFGGIAYEYANDTFLYDF